MRTLSVIAALVAISSSVAVAALLVYLGAMPPAMSELSGQKASSQLHPVVARGDELLVLGESELIAVRLPSGQIAARLPATPKGVRHLVSVVSARGAVLFTYLRGSATTGVAFVSAERDRVEWREQNPKSGRYQPPPSAYWDPERDRFVLVEIADTEVSLTPIDLEGRRGKAERFGVSPSELPPETRLCAIGAQLYATGGGRVCLLGPVSDGLRSCTPQPLRATCPGNLHGEPLGWLSESGPTELPPLPGSVGDAKLVERYVVVGARGMAPAAKWISEDLRTLYNLDDRFVLIEQIPPAEAQRLGYMREDHARIELLDGGSETLFRPANAWLLGPSANELVLLSATLDRIARFDRSTLRRLDEPNPDTALQRLRIWGGPSPLLEAALQIVPYGGALIVLALLALSLTPLRQNDRAWTLLRHSSALFTAVALAVILLTARKIWHF